MIVKYLNRGVFLSGSIYKFKYSNFKNDPSPLIIYLSSFKKNSKRMAFKNYMFGLNLHYLDRSQINHIVSFLEKVEISSERDWTLILKKFTYLKPILRLYNIKYVSGLKKIDSKILLNE